jgi:hypothetical protein
MGLNNVKERETSFVTVCKIKAFKGAFEPGEVVKSLEFPLKRGALLIHRS